MSAKYSYWIQSGKYNLMQKISVLGFGLLTFMLLARRMEPSVFGVWGFFLIFSSIIETLRSALARNGYIIFMNRNDETEHPAIEMASIVINIAYTVLTAVFILLSGSWLETFFNSPGLETVLQIYVVTLVVMLPFSQREMYFSASMNFRGIFFMYFTRNASFLICIFILFLLQNSIGLVQSSWLYAGTSLLGTLAGFLVERNAVFRTMRWHAPVFKKFFHHSRYVLGTNLASLIFRNTDSLITARFIDSAGLAFYNSCNRVTNTTDIPNQVLRDIMFPKAAQVVKGGQSHEIRRIYEKTVGASLTVIIPAIILVEIFAPQILWLLAGKQYLAAAPILRIAIFYGLFLPFVNQFGNMMDATGSPNINWRVNAFFAVFNIGSNILFIKAFGLLGAAWGTLSSYFVFYIISQIVLNKKLGVQPLNVFRETIRFYPEYLHLIRSKLTQVFKTSKS